MDTTFFNRDIVSISDFSKSEMLHILARAQQYKANPSSDILAKKILANCFFEPSTRTRLSFETAMLRLGGSAIGFSDSKFTSVQKGESFQDTIKVVGKYADVVVVRHPKEGAAQLAADILDIPVINAGDGANQHPTQTFLDLFTIQECQGKLEDLNIAMVGDLKHGRTVHSLSQALIPFQTRLYFVSPVSLEMPKMICDTLKEKGIKFSFHRDVQEIIERVDVLYMTRIQEERFSHKTDFESLKTMYTLHPSLFQAVKPNLKVLHPLPRNGEIDPKVDLTPYAYYFQQAENGLCVRQALLALVLEGVDTLLGRPQDQR